MIAYCGLDCSNCPIRLATGVTDRKKQEQMRQDIARQIEELYGMKCRSEDIVDCDGCSVPDGRLFSACRQCAIRKCALEKGLENCAHCSEYACEKLKEFFAFGGKLVHGNARIRLDEIREAMGKNGT
jgi:hypothetical protein